MINRMSQENALFLDFGQVTAAHGGDYFTPGQWIVSATGAELKETDQKKSKYLAVTFEHEDGRKHTEKFFLSSSKGVDSTKKMLGRLQLLHEALYGMAINKNFGSYEEMAAHFDAGCKKNAKKKLQVIMGGQESGGKVYANLIFADFIVNDPNFEEKEYEEGSKEYNKVVTKEKTPSSNAPILNLNPALATDAKMPWEQVKYNF